jgi:thiamine-phosphate pyrophosphorylase
VFHVPAVLLPRLQAIVDADVAARAGWAPLDLARAFLDGRARFIQLRAKLMPSGEFLNLCDRVVAAATAYDAIVIVNDRADLACLSGAGGVHLGQDDLSVAAARGQLSDRAIIGASTHTVEQIDRAVREAASYIAIGPVFGTVTKDTGYNAIGLEMVSAAAKRATGIPVVAIGGITLDTAPAVIGAGASSVAVISDLLTGGDPVARVRSFVDCLG